MTSLNLTIFHFINGGAGHYYVLDHILLFLTSYLMYAVSIAIAFYILVWIPAHDTSLSRRLFSLREQIAFLVSIFITWIVVQIMKYSFASPRPFKTLIDIHALSPYESGYSFPSGHAALTIAIATILYFHHKRLGVLLYGFALIVCISRIYIGVHYPVDVVAGGLIGFAIPTLIHYMFKPHASIVWPREKVALGAKKG